MHTFTEEQKAISSGDGNAAVAAEALNLAAARAMRRPKAVIMADNVFFHDGDIVDYVYGRERIAAIRSRSELHPVRIVSGNLEAELPNLADVEVIFSCWGMLPLTPEQLDRLPNLKVVFYASGAVNGFAGPLADRGITVCSGLKANAIPVAEFCLAQILLAMKGYWTNTARCNRGPWRQAAMPVGPGVYGETVALIGVGTVCRHLLRLLKPFRLRVIGVSDCLPDHPPEAVRAMGIDRLVSIDEAFREGYVVSNHLPDTRSLRGVLTREHFASMRRGATFINTGRGGQVDERGLIDVLKARPDLTALLDVQHPEPPEAGSELFALPNVHMTSHIAGSANDEVHRMADFMIEDFVRWICGEPLRHAVDLDELKRMA